MFETKGGGDSKQISNSNSRHPCTDPFRQAEDDLDEHPSSDRRRAMGGSRQRAEPEKLGWWTEPPPVNEGCRD